MDYAVMQRGSETPAAYDDSPMVADFRRRFWFSAVLSVPVLAQSRPTYGKMIQNLMWATGYYTFAIQLAAGLAFPWGILLTPAVGAAPMSLSAVILAINAKLLERARNLLAGSAAAAVRRAVVIQQDRSQA